MNKDMYRLVWNRSLGALQVVSEAAKSKACAGSVAVSGPRVRARGKAAAWPLALLTLGIASSAMAAAYDVTTNADSGPGSLRDQLASGGWVNIDPAISSIALATGATLSPGPITLQVGAPLVITGPGLIGSGSTLAFEGAVTTTISGQFNGLAGTGGISANAADASGTSAPGANATLSGVSNGTTAITGNYFDLTNKARVTGGQGVSLSTLGTGGRGGNGLTSGTGTIGGTGGAGASGNSASSGGTGIYGNYATVRNSGVIGGGNGANGATGGSGGSGGDGGAATNAGKYGGNGGSGGSGGRGGNGGKGGIGIEGVELTITNSGIIQGGNGGTAGAGGAGGAGGTAGTPTGLNSINGTSGSNGVAGTAGVGGVGIVAYGSSTIYNAGTISGGLANGGAGTQANAIELSNGNNKLVLESGSVINGNVVSYSGGSDVLALGGNTGVNVFNLASLGSTQQYRGFGSFEKEGNSTWILRGEDTTAKNWTVNTGTLVLDDLASLEGSVNILQNGRFSTGSDGYIVGNLDNNGHLLIGSTASPYAELAIEGDYTQSSTGTLQIGVLSKTQYSSFSVGGDVALAGTLDVDVKSGDTLAISNRLQGVINSGGSLSGAFSSVTDNSLLFDFTPTYNNQSVDLNVIASTNGGGTGGPNTVTGSAQALGNTQARGAAAVLDGVITRNTGSALAQRFIPLSTHAEVSQALSDVLPMVDGSTTAATSALTSINQVVQARNETASGLSSGDEVMTDEHFWIKPFGSWARQDSSGGASGMRSDVGGMAFGLDGSLNSRWTLGAAFVYANANTRSTGGTTRQSLDTDVYQLVGYGTYHLDDATDLRLQIDGGQNQNDGRRDIDFAGLKAKSSYNSLTAHAGAALDHTIKLSQSTRFTPSVRADYTWIKDDSYTEKGAEDLNLKVKSRSTDQFILGVDGKLSHDLNEQVNLSGNLGVGYDFLAESGAISSTFAGAPGAAFTTYGGDAQRWLVRGGTALSYQVNGQLELAVRYDVETRSDYLNQTASAEARWAF